MFVRICLYVKIYTKPFKNLKNFLNATIQQI